MRSTFHETSLDWLASRIMFGMKAGLDNIEALTRRLGSPQQRLTTVHIAGSNGKGSTASLLAALATTAGIRTGLFTSPHLVSVRERFRIDGAPIDRESLERCLGAVRVAAEQEPPLPVTFFEVVTAATLVWFAEQKVELAVLEVGLGGRLDSTNVADSRLAVLTGISLEHVDILGETEEKILGEKLGVTRRGARCLFALPDRLVPELERRAAEMGFESERLADDSWSVRDDGTASVRIEGETFVVGRFPGMPLPMIRNRMLAVRAFSVLGGLDTPWKNKAVLSLELLRRAISSHRWAARYQQLCRADRPDLLIDGAHNPEAVEMLSSALSALRPECGFTVVMGVVSDKNVEAMIDALLPIASRFLFVRTPYPRFRNPDDLVECVAGRRECRSFGTDLTGALREAWRRENPVVVCGSLYLMGEVIVLLRDDYEELKWFQQFAPDRNESR